MPVQPTKRDYSLIGKDSKHAEEMGLASAEWYACPIARKPIADLWEVNCFMRDWLRKNL